MTAHTEVCGECTERERARANARKAKPDTTYMCPSGSCEGHEQPHHPLDCPTDLVRLVYNAVLDANASLG